MSIKDKILAVLVAGLKDKQEEMLISHLTPSSR